MSTTDHNANHEKRVRVIEKIRKLLTLAKDGRGNPTEAETAMRQAQALMAAYSIEESEALSKEFNGTDAIIQQWARTGITKHRIVPMAKIPVWATCLAMGVGAMWDCRVFSTRHREHGKVILFGGTQVDVPIAVWTFEYLQDCVKRAATNFEDMIKGQQWEKLGGEFGFSMPACFDLTMQSPKKRLEEFRFAMSARLQQRMIKLGEERRAHMASASAGGRALVVSKRALLEKKYGPEDDAPGEWRKVGAAGRAGMLQAERTRLDPGPLAGTPAAPFPLLR